MLYNRHYAIESRAALAQTRKQNNRFDFKMNKAFLHTISPLGMNGTNTICQSVFTAIQTNSRSFFCGKQNGFQISIVKWQAYMCVLTACSTKHAHIYICSIPK